MNNLPKISSYGNYDSDNYGSHTLKVDMANFVLYYSYDTIIAFYDKEGLVCTKNKWKSTTGKHLNWIEPRKEYRIDYSDFVVKLEEMLKRNLNQAE
jgi:hypothetical protein